MQKPVSSPTIQVTIAPTAPSRQLAGAKNPLSARGTGNSLDDIESQTDSDTEDSSIESIELKKDSSSLGYGTGRHRLVTVEVHDRDEPA